MILLRIAVIAIAIDPLAHTFNILYQCHIHTYSVHTFSRIIHPIHFPYQISPPAFCDKEPFMAQTLYHALLVRFKFLTLCLYMLFRST